MLSCKRHIRHYRNSKKPSERKLERIRLICYFVDLKSINYCSIILILQQNRTGRDAGRGKLYRLQAGGCVIMAVLPNPNQAAGRGWSYWPSRFAYPLLQAWQGVFWLVLSCGRCGELAAGNLLLNLRD